MIQIIAHQPIMVISDELFTLLDTSTASLFLRIVLLFAMHMSPESENIHVGVGASS